MMFDKFYENFDECVNDALSLASEYANDGVERNIGGPFGAAIIKKYDKGYKIIVIARNTVLMENDPTCHAEINAIKKASRILGKYELSDCVLVSTAKSCPMCISAACWARIPMVKYSLDYDFAEKYGFIDRTIAHYIKGKNNIIKEEKVKNKYVEKPFETWQNKENKKSY